MRRVKGDGPYVLASNPDGHICVIPVARRKEWYALLPTDARPNWAAWVPGSPALVEFMECVIDPLGFAPGVSLRPPPPTDWDAVERAERATLEPLIKRIGYGRSIDVLRRAWTAQLMADYHLPEHEALRATSTVCPYCDTDTRTKTKAEVAQ